jgi:hypothetical protein
LIDAIVALRLSSTLKINPHYQRKRVNQNSADLLVLKMNLFRSISKDKHQFMDRSDKNILLKLKQSYDNFVTSKKKLISS